MVRQHLDSVEKRISELEAAKGKGDKGERKARGPNVALPVKHARGHGRQEEETMKICVTAMGKDLDAPTDPRFGRCQYFLIVDTESLGFDAIENPGIGARGGAGSQGAQLVLNKGVDVVLTGNVGPNAFHALQAAGIKIAIGVSGTVRTALEDLKAGRVEYVDAPSVGAHFGMGGGMGSRGGMGRGMRIGRGRSFASHQGPPEPQASTPQKLKALREEARNLKKRLEQIDNRIAQMTRKKGR
jgi:predicted Fe-Mo cluster-binding NifX family protein